MPLDSRVLFTDMLFSDIRTFLAGSLTTLAVIAYLAFRTASAAAYLIFTLMALLTTWRYVQFRRYHAARHAGGLRGEAARWERAYEAGAVATTSLTGFLCLLALGFSNDIGAQLLAALLAISITVGVVGRNFTSTSLVNAQLTVLYVPYLLGLLISGAEAHLLLFGFMLPFLVSVRAVARSLQSIFLNAIFSSHEAGILANRFDAALSNLPNGLSMFDETGRLVVSNPRWAQYLNVDPATVRFGWTLQAMVDEYVACGAVSIEQGAAALEMLGPPAPGLHAEKRNGVAIADRIFNISSERLANGGFLTMLEDITAQYEANARLAHMARYDALTGLPNRVALQERIEQVLKAQRKDDPFGVLFVDVDNFKHVNDTLGHAVGDALLFEVAERISAQLRAQDIVARFAGDEFVILQRNCNSPDEAAALANRVMETLAQPYMIDDHEIVAGASVGIALAPRDGMSIEMLFKKADMALYRAKASGRNAFSFFEDEMDARAQERRALEIDMRAALKAATFEPYYQPLYNLRSNSVTICEALVRWPHPHKGLISPGTFIPLAEENGMIVEIGAQVLHKACVECSQWPSNVSISVNISPVQIRRSDVVDLVARTLRETGLAANRLEIEITESALLHDMEATVSVLDRLRSMGVRTALDDFGTGYSSLSHLRNLPLNKVKIDRAFLKNIETDRQAQKLLRGMAQLSADLDMTVVIEGVETFEQLKIIAALGTVDEVQGFLFSKPSPSHIVRTLLAEPVRPLQKTPPQRTLRALA